MTTEGLQMLEEHRTDALALNARMDGQELDPTEIASHDRGTESLEPRVVHCQNLLVVRIAEDRSHNGRRREQVVRARYASERSDLGCVVDAQGYGRLHRSIM